MVKKSFNKKRGFDSLLSGPHEKDEIIPEESIKEKKPPKFDTRVTFEGDKDVINKVKAMAYWERVLIKDIINKALIEEVKRYEKAKGEILSIPKR